VDDTTYDSYGLPTDVVKTGVAGKEICSKTSYTQDAASNKVAYPYQAAAYTYTASTACGSGTLLGKSQVWYDGHANLTDLPGAGLPTKTQTLVSTIPSTVWSTAIAQYDSYGRQVTSTDARGRTVTTAYTPANGGPITGVATTDQFFTSGNTATTTIDPTVGPTVVVDLNGRKTEATYDALGRVTAVWKPTEDRAAGAPASALYSYEINAAAPSKLTAQVLQQINGPGNTNPVYLVTYTYSDGLLRLRNSQAPTPGGTGRIVTETKYDNRGNAATTAPFYNSGVPGSGLVTTTAASVPSQTVASYDNQNWPSTITLQALGVNQSSTGYSYDGDRATVLPPDGGATRAYVDAWGRTSRLEVYPTSAVTGSHETTTYEYDTAGNLQTLTDPAANITSYGYNLAGWRTSITDPDAGTSTIVYNAAGDVTATIDGRGQKVSTDYDQLGRPTIRWAGDSGTGTKLAAYTYDTLANAKGLPTSSTRYTGPNGVNQYTTTVTGYDARNRATGTTCCEGCSKNFRPGLEVTHLGRRVLLGYPIRVATVPHVCKQGFPAPDAYCLEIFGVSCFTHGGNGTLIAAQCRHIPRRGGRFVKFFARVVIGVRLVEQDRPQAEMIDECLLNFVECRLVVEVGRLGNHPPARAIFGPHVVQVVRCVSDSTGAHLLYKANPAVPVAPLGVNVLLNFGDLNARQLGQRNSSRNWLAKVPYAERSMIAPIYLPISDMVSGG
jgi:YD repeat-containing protein